MRVWFVFSTFFFFARRKPAGFAVLDCWFERRLDWERWLETVPRNKTLLDFGTQRIPPLPPSHPSRPRAALVQIQKMSRVSVKRKRQTTKKEREKEREIDREGERETGK